MAEEREDISNDLSFGIMDTSVMGNYKAVDGFLSGKILKDGEEVEEITEEEEEETPTTKKAVKKPVVLDPKKKKEIPKKEPLLDPFAIPEETEEEETTPETEEEEEKGETTEEEEETTSSENPFEDISKELYQLGIFKKDDDKEEAPKTGEEFLAKFRAEQQRGATEWLDGFLSQFGDDRKELFQAIFVSGVDPTEYLPVYNEVQNLEGLDMSIEKNQERVYREFYKRLKFTPEQVETKLQKAKDYGDLESDSTTFHQQMVNDDKEILESQQEAKEQAKATEKRIDTEYKASVTKILADNLKNKEFKGFPLDDKTARQALDFLYTKKYKTADGTYLTEFDKFVMDTKRPENHENRVLLTLLKLNNFDFSKITKRAVSKESNALFNSFVQKKVKSTSGVKTAAPAGKNWLGL